MTVGLREPLAPGAPVTLGIRPEHVVLDRPEAIPVTVFAAERLGEGTYLYASVDGSGEQIVVRADPDAQWNIGQQLAVGAVPGRIHVFGEDGRRCSAN